MFVGQLIAYGYTKNAQALQPEHFFKNLFLIIIVFVAKPVDKNTGIRNNRDDERTGERSTEQSVRQFTVHKGKKKGEQIKGNQYHGTCKSENTLHIFHKSSFLKSVFCCFRKGRINIFFCAQDIMSTCLTYTILIFDPVMNLLKML